MFTFYKVSITFAVANNQKAIIKGRVAELV